jgi:hypothetical protein
MDQHATTGRHGVPVPELTSRSGTAWLIGTGGLLLLTQGYLFWRYPEYRIGVVVLLVVVVLVVLALSRRAVWVDPAAGTLTVTRHGRATRRVRIEPSASTSLVPNGGGGLLLAVQPAGARRRFFVPVLALTQHVERSQSPELLRLLADTLEQHRAGGSRVVVLALRGQADHVEAGGTARTSPLAAQVTHGAAAAGQAGAAGAVGGHLG